MHIYCAAYFKKGEKQKRSEGEKKIQGNKKMVVSHMDAISIFIEAVVYRKIKNTNDT